MTNQPPPTYKSSMKALSAAVNQDVKVRRILAYYEGMSAAEKLDAVARQFENTWNGSVLPKGTVFFQWASKNIPVSKTLSGVLTSLADEARPKPTI
jgi:hypothetical protein